MNQNRDISDERMMLYPWIEDPYDEGIDYNKRLNCHRFASLEKLLKAAHQIIIRTIS